MVVKCPYCNMIQDKSDVKNQNYYNIICQNKSCSQYFAIKVIDGMIKEYFK